MDDFSVTSLGESKTEWCARLVNLLTPCVIQGLKSIFQEAWKLCEDNKETDKYLMTFQTFLGRVPKWNETLISNEVQRIIDTSRCNYLEDLITCVHVVHLKALTCVRVSTKAKKIDINVPSLSTFVHNVYINVARKVYTNVYLFEMYQAPLQVQKNNWALESIVKECILNTIRDSLPVETILKAYLDETEDQTVEVQETAEIVQDPSGNAAAIEEQTLEEAAAAATDDDTNVETSVAAAADVVTDDAPTSAISFNDVDQALTDGGTVITEVKPKDDVTLDMLAAQRAATAALMDDDDDDEDAPLQISDEIISFDIPTLDSVSKEIDLGIEDLQ
jgi:hypothetical protein